jgi:hypothetical protein
MQYLPGEQQIVQEALRRGADEKLLITFIIWRRVSARQATTAPEEYKNLKTLLSQLIAQDISYYYNIVEEEYRNLRIDFSPPRGQLPRRDANEHYHFMRPKYYMAGYDNPLHDIFNNIRPYFFLGKKVGGGGLHNVFIHCLDGVPAELEKISSGLSDRVQASIKFQDAGFVPRYIAGSETLSNHAYGLAIDIDPGSNPHLLTPVIAILNEVVVRRTGIAFDFGASYTQGREWSGVLTDEQKAKVLFANARLASNAVQEWLQQKLPTYEDCIAKIAAGRRSPSASPARKDADDAEQTMKEDRELQLLQLIRGDGSDNYPSVDTLHSWAKTGIQTIPIELAIAIAHACRKMGFPRKHLHRPERSGWGQDYTTSKDAMHFEIEAVDAIPPNSAPRSLPEVFPADFLPFYELWLVGADVANILSSGQRR